jgi:hypothetical protein
MNNYFMSFEASIRVSMHFPENHPPPLLPRGGSVPVSPNILGEFVEETDQDVKFPKKLRFNGKGKVLATIYCKEAGRPYYRLYWRVRDANGKPRSCMQDCPTYSSAR